MHRILGFDLNRSDKSDSALHMTVDSPNDSCDENFIDACRRIDFSYAKLILISLFLSLPLGAYALGGGASASAWSYSGWACDPSAPGYQSAVHARRDDGEFLGSIIADRPSESVFSSACGSPHDAHGFQLFFERKPEWADGKSHDVTLYAIDHAGNSVPFDTVLMSFTISSGDVEPPRMLGDIVGRDLDVPELGKIGHLGIWDGSMVIEVLNESNAPNKVFRNTWENFKSRTAPWDTAHPRYPGYAIKSCWSNSCDINANSAGEVTVSVPQAIVNRAMQVYMIGADYTYTLQFTTAEPAMRDYKDPRWHRRAIRGRYRSDAFIYDAFRATTDIDNAGIFPYRVVFGMEYSWREKVANLHGFALTLPFKVMEKIRGF